METTGAFSRAPATEPANPPRPYGNTPPSAPASQYAGPPRSDGTCGLGGVDVVGVAGWPDGAGVPADDSSAGAGVLRACGRGPGPGEGTAPGGGHPSTSMP